MLGFNEVMQSEDGDEENEDSLEPPFKRMKPDWEICGLDTRNYEESQLMKPSVDRSVCFGCVYVGERDKTIVDKEELAELIKMIRESIASCDSVTIAHAVAKRYAKIRRETNENLLPGQAELPEWPAAMVLDHIRNHHVDPELQTWSRLMEIQELIQIALKSSVETNDDGKKRINPQQFRVYQDAVKLWMHVSKTDINKCVFKSNGRVVDMEKATQTPIAFSDKTIYDFFKPV